MASPEEVAPTAFLSYSSEDRKTVRDLYRRLTGDGVSCWFDEQNLLPGQDWDLEIRRALVRCRFVLVCLSNSSIYKIGYGQKELSRALNRAEEQPEGFIYLVPVRLEPCDVPDRLQRWQRVDLFDRRGYERLLRVLRSEPTGPGGSRPGRSPTPATPGPVSDRGTPERDTGRAPQTSVADRVSRRITSSRARAAASVMLALVLVIGAAAYSQGGLGGAGGRPGDRSSPMSVAPPVESPSTSSAAPADGFVLFDDFSGEVLDSARWAGGGGAAPIMTVADGVLRVAATQEAGDGGSADIHAIFPGAVEAVRFVMTVQRVDGRNDGGAHARITGSSGRHHEVWGGPRGDGAPTIGYAICQTETECSDYDAFTQRGERLVPLGQPVTVVVRRGGEGWEVYLDGESWTRAAVERGPIEGLTLGAYSFGRGFSVDFDDVYVAYP